MWVAGVPPTEINWKKNMCGALLGRKLMLEIILAVLLIGSLWMVVNHLEFWMEDQ